MPPKVRTFLNDDVCGHVAQLFDTSDSLVTALSQFIRGEAANDRCLLVIARSRNWAAVAARLARNAWPIDTAIQQRRLVVVEAEVLLPKLIRDEMPQPDLFQQHVSTLITDLLAGSPWGLSAYGELVELLAEEGNFEAVRRLEELWNGLISARSFKLLCGYSAAHFASPTSAWALHVVRDAHSRIHAKPADVLSTWLLDTRLSAIAEST